MTRRCSHCSHNGHNSRTCPNRGVKLFGVRLTDGSIRKSASMGNLTHFSGSAHQNTAPGSPAETPEHPAAADGYASEDLVPGSVSSSRERKKGTPWTEEEHRVFLFGLQKLGKGDWRGISRNYVLSRTPTQVASHAQKYFIRQANVSKKKRRSSLFDIVADEPVDTTVPSQDLLSTNLPLPEESSPQLMISSVLDEEDCESMKSSDSNEGELTLPKPDNSSCPYPVMVPAYISPFYPFSPPLWSGYAPGLTNMETHEVLKPTATHSKSLINVDELVGMSKLSLGESLVNAGSSLSLKLQEGTTRQSAFHANPASTGSGMNSSNNPIHAV